MTERNEILLFGWVVVVVIGLSRFDVLFISGGREMDERELRDWAIELERENERLKAEVKAYQCKVDSLVSWVALSGDREGRLYRNLREACAESKRLEGYVADPSDSVYHGPYGIDGRLWGCSSCLCELLLPCGADPVYHGWSEGGGLCYACKFPDYIRLFAGPIEVRYCEDECEKVRDFHTRPYREQLLGLGDDCEELRVENERLDAARKGWTDAIARSVQLRKAAEAVCDDLTAEIAELKAEIDRLTPPEGQLLSVSIVRDDDDQRGVFAEINFHNSKLETMFAGPQESAIGWMAKELGDYYGVYFTDPGEAAEKWMREMLEGGR